MDNYSTESIIELNKAGYNAIAEQFSSTRNYSWADVEYLFKYVKPEDKIIDIGCGNGRLLTSPQLPVSSSNYFGIDNSEGLINEARRLHSEFKFEVADISELNASHLTLNTFNSAFCISVLNHFSRESHDRVLQNIKRCLKPDGCLLMVNWNLWSVRNKKGFWRTFKKNILTTWKGGDKEARLFYYAFTKGEIRKLLEKNGFKVVESLYSKRGKASSWLFGNNIVTVAKVK